jgi:hypothetical protein
MFVSWDGVRYERSTAKEAIRAIRPTPWIPSGDTSALSRAAEHVVLRGFQFVLDVLTFHVKVFVYAETADEAKVVVKRVVYAIDAMSVREESTTRTKRERRQMARRGSRGRRGARPVTATKAVLKDDLDAVHRIVSGDPDAWERIASYVEMVSR